MNSIILQGLVLFICTMAGLSLTIEGVKNSSVALTGIGMFILSLVTWISLLN